jgi:hypothetical protein
MTLFFTRNAPSTKTPSLPPRVKSLIKAFRSESGPKLANNQEETNKAEPNIDKQPRGTVQKKIEKSEKKTCHPLKC